MRRRQGLIRLDSRPFCGSDPGEPPFLSSLAPPFSPPHSPKFSSCLSTGRWILRCLGLPSSGGRVFHNDASGTLLDDDDDDDDSS